MIEFDYKLDYKNILFRPNDRRYRIGRGEQGVLLVIYGWQVKKIKIIL